MSLETLRLAAELGGTRLSGSGGPLVIVERIRSHGLPALAVLGREAAHLREVLDAWAECDAALNLVCLLPGRETHLAEALVAQRRRIGAVTAALDASLPWLDGKPMVAKRFPGRMAGEVSLEPTPMGPLEREELRNFLKAWSPERIHRTFIQPQGPRDVTLLWSDVPVPRGVDLLVQPLRLAVGSPLMDALRTALRRGLDHPIPLLPLPEDPSGLHALQALSEKVAAFRGPRSAWVSALSSLAELPAPPHFCARC